MSRRILEGFEGSISINLWRTQIVMDKKKVAIVLLGPLLLIWLLAMIFVTPWLGVSLATLLVAWIFTHLRKKRRGKFACPIIENFVLVN